MSDQTQTKPLTVNDPVGEETIKKLERLAYERARIADDMLRMEQNKVSMLVGARLIDDEQSRVFSQILLDRGLAPGTLFELDHESGLITVLPPPGAPQG